jgi:phage tail sheath protein FI
MPAVLSYPGVYIEEVPSGVRTLVGVATSITAMVGRTRRGPLNRPVRVFSFAGFDRVFGSLWDDGPLSFAALHCFQNGGSDLLVVRVANNAVTCTATLPHDGGGGNLVLEAATSVTGESLPDPGTWATQLRATVDYDGAGSTTLAAPLFNLTLSDLATGARETYFNLSADSTSPRFITSVLASGSLMARVVSGAGTRPAITPVGPPVPIAFADSSVAPATADGDAVTAAEVVTGATLEGNRAGIYALEHADLFNILCLPPYSATTDVAANDLTNALAYCMRRRAMLLVDPPTATDTVAEAQTFANALTRSENAAFYFPRILAANPLREGRIEAYAPCGAVAGVLARTDASRGVWKTPAGLDATLNGVAGLAARLTDMENGVLNPQGINCLRELPAAGRVVWGGRTLRGADQLASEWKYLAVRRTALFLEESLYRGTQWVVFEPNDEPLWAQIRLNIGAFMNNLFRQGAFQGTSPRDAYFVKCDRETTTQSDINLGIVNIVVGFAPLKPAEFVIVKLQQMAGQVQA